MVLGAVWCAMNYAPQASSRMRQLKANHGVNRKFEIKWTKVSPGKLQLYRDVLDYFFDSDQLSFRGLVADKTRLRHSDFEQTHDDWYYKMYFDMLKLILQPGDCFRIYLDIKDTRSAAKVRKLHEVLASNIFDFSRDIIERVQTVRSHEVELLQLADLLVGATSAANRGPIHSDAKRFLVEQMRARSHYTLQQSTLFREKKVNLFHWRSAENSLNP